MLNLLERCLSGIPEGRYSARLRKELEGHLAALEADLTAAGYAPEEAQADAALLRHTFRGRRRKRLLITLGLLLTWVCEKGAIMLISTLLYGFLPLPELMYRIAYGGDQSAPWFKYYYLIWTFCACFPLGWLFGGGEAGLPAADRGIAR